jgi:hypothetical protein
MADVGRRVLVAGHSHANTLFGRRLRESIEPKIIQLDEERDLFGLVGAFPRTPDYWEALKAEATGSTVVILWAGNDYNGGFLFEVSPRFDFVREDTPEVDETAELVPAGAVEQLFYQVPHMRDLERLLAELREVPDCRVILMETPPPKGDDAELRKRLAAEFGAKAEARGFSVENVPLSPPVLRRKLWLSMYDACRRVVNETGAEYLALPPWAFDEGGFLKVEYWHSDATHANLDYATALKSFLVERLLA